MPGAQISWNEDLQTLLLHCVIVKGAHIGKDGAWNAVNDMFFDQPELADKKAQHYVKGEPGCRKLKDKMKRIIDSVQSNIDTGNQSGKSGDMSPLFRHVLQIVEEREAWKEKNKNKNKRSLSELLTGTEKAVFERSGPLKQKAVNGEIIDNTKNQNGRIAKSNSRDSEILKAIMEDKDVDAVKARETFELRFQKWAKDTNKTVLDLLDVSELSVTHEVDISEVGLKTLINMHCIREGDAPASVFKSDLKEFGLLPLVSSKLYMGLQQWRREVEQLAAEEAAAINVTPAPLQPSSLGIDIAMASDRSAGSNRSDNSAEV